MVSEHCKPQLLKPAASIGKRRKTAFGEQKKEKKRKKQKQPPQQKQTAKNLLTSFKGGVQWEDLRQQAKWFSAAFDSSCGSSLSHLEREPPLTEDNFLQLQPGKQRSSNNISEHVKSVFGDEWWSNSECNKEKGNPALLILCSSAVRCVEIFKGLKDLSKTCKLVKLFAKHFKLDEQVAALGDYVNIAVGTPNRIRKLIDISALGLAAISVILVDMFEDAKGFTLLTIPQVKDDFWQLYKGHFHERVTSGKVRICLY